MLVVINMYDVIVIGAGPAGIMAALTASKNNNKVLLLDKNERLGLKLSITGGTRGNLINLKEKKEFIKELPIKNGKFLYHALSEFSTKDLYNFFESNDIPLKVEDHDRVFPVSNKVTDVIDMFEKLMLENNVKIKLNEEVVTINDDMVITSKEKYNYKNIIITTGGSSYKHTGSSGDGYKFAKAFGHTVSDLYPAETPILSSDTVITSKELQGITISDCNASLYVNNKRIKEVRDNLLFTHFGFSGPAALKLSQYAYNITSELSINILDKNLDIVINELKAIKNNTPNFKTKDLYKGVIIRRYLNYILEIININNKSFQEVSNKEINALALLLTDFRVKIKGTRDISLAFVTGGGVNTKEISPKNMQSNIKENLYFAGEVLDLHGNTGGYNLTIAFTTGYLAGKSIKK